jgi:hypothetical protein
LKDAGLLDADPLGDILLKQFQGKPPFSDVVAEGLRINRNPNPGMSARAALSEIRLENTQLYSAVL